MTLPFAATPAEMIATIYFAHTQRGVSSGKFGAAFDVPATPFNDAGELVRVEVAGGPVVIVTMDGNLWRVMFKGMSGMSHDLEEAARNALEAGAGVWVSRNFSLVR